MSAKEQLKNQLLNTSKLLNQLDNVYVLVMFPESQQYMEKRWFKKEAILSHSIEITGNAAYFIPLNKL